MIISCVREEGEGRGGDVIVVEKDFANRDAMDVVEDLIGVIKTVGSYREFRRIQKKESHSLVRRLKFFLPFLEEMRDQKRPINETGLEALKKLNKAFHSARRLLKICHCGSKIYLAVESEAIMVKYHSVYEKLVQALDGLPYDDLGISDEDREELDLMREQMRKAKRRTDTQDMELAMDLMVVLSNDRNADSASIERLANKLGLRALDELKIETMAIEKLNKGVRGLSAESKQQIIDLQNKFKRLAGVPEINDQPEKPAVPKTLDKCVSLAVPHEFLCPITLEIMTDPVIIATGQSYERESIQQWFDSDHRTCPKTGQVVSHLNLAPNVALRNLILQWCEKNNYQLPKKEKPENNTSAKENDEEILSLVKDLSTDQLEVQRQAVTKIRMLSKESPENRILVANSGGIPPLVQLLSYPDLRIQEHAVTALLNLSIDESNKKLISEEQPIPAIIEVLQSGNIGAKENSAAALFSLSMIDENKVTIGALNGIPPLVDLLRNGTIRGKKDAVTALFNLVLNQANKARAIEAGIVSPLLKVLEDKRLDMVNEILSILLLLASTPEGHKEIGQLSFVETLVNLMRDGAPKNKECAAAILVELGSRNSNIVLAALQYGVYDYVIEIARNGTDRGQRKANAILHLMSKSEQI